MIFFTIGLPSSASTWIYNVVRAILNANGLRHAAFLGETMGDFIHANLGAMEHAVVKGHRFEGGFHQVLQLAGLPMILSMRDPRDATASLIQRFHLAPGVSAMHINRSLVNIIALADTCNNMTFLFEDRFSDSKQSVKDIASYLKLALSDEQADAIFDAYHSDKVKQFIASLTSLPEGRLKQDGGDYLTDRDTQFHERHITDKKIGKWSSFFTPAVAESLDTTFRDYIGLLSREHLQKKGGVSRYMKEFGFTVSFDTRLFAPVDDLHNYTRDLIGEELIGDLGLKRLDNIHVPVGRWEMTFACNPNYKIKSISICQDGKVVCRSANENGLSFVYENRLPTHPFDLFVETDDMATHAYAPPEGRLTGRYLSGLAS